MKLAHSFLFLAFSAVLLFPACKDDDGGGSTDPCSSDFDQSALFSNVAENIIVPAYAQLQEKVDALSDQTALFVATPTVAELTTLRSLHLDAYLAWQEVASFEFGPAEEVFLRNSLNNFPTNIGSINTNISSGTYDFDQNDAYDKGFPALDYLLHGTSETDAATIVEMFTTEANRSQYLSELVADISQRVNHTVEGWADGYQASFIANTGTAAGTSLSLLINNFNLYYELIKREKIGIPSGVLTLNFPNPEKVEAYYGGHSVQLASTALRALERLYLGKDKEGNNGQGFDDYLIALEASKGGEQLDDLIQAQFTAAITKLETLDDPLPTTIENDQNSVEETYNEIVKQLVNIKTDMPSVFCVSITYIDNPSDSD